VELSRPKGETLEELWFPVYYVEPLLGNEALEGFDLGSTQARLAVLETIADVGQLVATESIKLVQDTGAQAGSLVLIPVSQHEMPLTTAGLRRLALQGFGNGGRDAAHSQGNATRDEPALHARSCVS
jgi:CHASE1-domain containing sensor protein